MSSSASHQAHDAGGAVITGPAGLALQARDIGKRYGGIVALRGVDLDIRAGEVHCLAGANGSGKSTLIKILSGVEAPDTGQITVDGQPLARLGVLDAMARGIQVIYQDLSLFPNLNVVENIAMTSRTAGRARIVSAGSGRRIARQALDRLALGNDVGIELDADVSDLTVAHRQLVAIARALACDVRVLFMDEPTTTLTWREVDTLFTVVERLRSEGVAIVFVSHKTDEVMRISDRITVLRNGQVVRSDAAANLDRRALIEALTGQVEEVRAPQAGAWRKARAVMQVHELGSPTLFRDVTFDLHAGEILGLTGLLGSGRTEVAEAIFGLVPRPTGTVRIDGTDVPGSSVDAAIDAGVAYVPPDRMTQGVFLAQSIRRNIAAAWLRQTSRHGTRLSAKSVDRLVERMTASLNIKIGRASDPVRSLSGGNAQKVVLAKWLATNPKVLMLNGPTVGVDIASKAAILDILRERAAGGMAVLLISDDVEELVNACDRILVIRKGKLSQLLEGEQISIERVREGIVT
jgi:simple sugar transport system ATP-binding protein